MTTFQLSPPPNGPLSSSSSSHFQFADGSKSSTNLLQAPSGSTVRFSDLDSYSTADLVSPTLSLHAELDVYEGLEPTSSSIAIRDRSTLSTEVTLISYAVKLLNNERFGNEIICNVINI